MKTGSEHIANHTMKEQLKLQLSCYLRRNCSYHLCKKRYAV